MKVLVVEDSRAQALRLQADLRQQGFDVLLAFNGRQGLESAARERPDVILSDVLMPDIDGFRLCRELQLDPELCSIPVVLRSAAFLDEEDRNLALAVGATAYIEKVIEGRELARVLEQARRDHHALGPSGAPDDHGFGATYASRLLSHLVEQAARSERVNEDLRQTQRMLQAVMDSSPALVWVKDLEGRYLMVNDQLPRTFGVPSEDMIGRTASEVFSAETEGEYERNFEMVVQAGHAMEFEEIVDQDDGAHTYLSTKFPLKDDEGFVYGVCGISIDITDRKLFEERLRRAEKAELIGRLTGGIAHDFNNLLSVITNYASFASEGLDGSDQRAQDLSEVLGAAQRGADLVRQLLTFARGGTPTVEAVEVNELILGAEGLLRGLLGSRMALKLDLGTDLAPAAINSDQFGQVILNLVVNARDAMPEGGAVAIATASVRVDEGLAARSAEIPAGDYVRVDVTDTGTGIPPEVLERIFDPFFTTKAEGSGTGLGLSTVHGIVRGVGGGITIDSEVGAGTTFHIYLPEADEAEVGASPEALEAPVARSGAILVVDDEEGIRKAVRRVLEQRGYAVETAASGREAAELYEAHGREIALLISDISMPGMTGLELGRRLEGLPGDVQIIVMSGSMDPRGDTRLPPNAAFLPKPFTRVELLAKVQRAIGDPPVPTDG